MLHSTSPRFKAAPCHHSGGHSIQESSLMPHVSPIQPFLGGRAKISHALASHTVIFLLVSAYRLYQIRNVVKIFTFQAKQTFINDCATVERSLALLTSFPHIAAQGVNHGLVTALNSAISQIGYGLEIMLSGILASLDLIVSLLTGTWRCFLTSLANSDIPLLSEIGGGGVEAVDQMHKALISLLALPINGLQETIQQQMADPQIGLTVNVPTMPMQTIKFCEKMTNVVAIDKLGDDIRSWIAYGAWGSIGMAMVAIVLNMIWIAFNHKRRKVLVRRIQRQLTGGQTEPRRTIPTIKGGLTIIADVDEKGDDFTKLCALRADYMIRHPLLCRVVNWSVKRMFPCSEDSQNLLFWFLSYIFYPPATTCLFLGLLGISLIFGQTALLQYFEVHYSPVLTTILTDVSTTVLRAVNDAMATTSATFATQTNAALSQVESDINANVFSEIVRAAEQMNAALTQVQTTLRDGVRMVFGDTAFGTLILTVLECLLLKKITTVETGLSWIQNHARITFPRLESNVLIVNQAEIDQVVKQLLSRLSEASSSMLTSGGSSANSTVASHQTLPRRVEDLLLQVEKELRRDLPVYYGLVAVWCIVVVMGVLGVSCQKKKKETVSVPYAQCHLAAQDRTG